MRYPKVLESIPFVEGRLDDDVIHTRCGTRQKRKYDAALRTQLGLTPEREFALYCAARVRTDDSSVYEWSDIAEAALLSGPRFTFVELGAGHGRWTVMAAGIARLIGKKPSAIAVEAEPTHFAWLREHVADNRLQDVTLYEAAASFADGFAEFETGDPAGWYGQSLHRWHPRRWKGREPTPADARPLRILPAMSLRSIIGRRTVDLIHMDVQGAEADIVLGARDVLQKHVRRVHIGTHGRRVEERLRLSFNDMGWVAVRDYAGRTRAPTEFGDMDFEDGIQTWMNPQLA